MDQYKENIFTLRSAKQLHGAVEIRLASLLARAFPGSAAVPEVVGTLGGRNDLIQYFFDSRRVVFEVFCSKSQVPQDLRLLEQSEAAVKIAILIDADVDHEVSSEYFHKKPDAFPFVWLRWVMVPRWESIVPGACRR